MTPARARTIFIAALLISLLVHIFLAGYVRWPFLNESSESQIAKVRITHIARMIVPRTPAPSPPPPVPAAPATPRVRASIKPPAVHSAMTSRAPGVRTVGVGARTPAPVTTAVPATPIATAAPVGPCGGHSDSEPAVTSTPDVAPISEQARAAKVSGTAAVHVALDAQGHVTNATIAQSSGNSGLDESALAMARSATYAPRFVHCKAVAGEYTFTVQFVAW